MRLRRTVGIWAALAVTLVLAACGGGSAAESTTTSPPPEAVPADPDAMVEAIAETVRADSGGLLSPEEATCVATIIVNVVGSDVLVDAGARGASFADLLPLGTEEQAGQLANGVLDCTDLGALMAAALLDDDGSAAIGAEAAECLGDRVAESEVFRRLMVEALLAPGDGDNPFALDLEAAGVLVDLLLDCVDFGEFFIALLPPEAEISEESARCLGDAMAGSASIRDQIARSVLGEDVDPFADPASGAEVRRLVLDCFTAEELLRLNESPPADDV